MPVNVLEENSRQMDRHKERLVFRTLIGNSEVCVEVHALQSGGDGAPERSEMGLHSSANLIMSHDRLDVCDVVYKIW